MKVFTNPCIALSSAASKSSETPEELFLTPEDLFLRSEQNRQLRELSERRLQVVVQVNEANENSNVHTHTNYGVRSLLIKYIAIFYSLFFLSCLLNIFIEFIQVLR